MLSIEPEMASGWIGFHMGLGWTVVITTWGPVRMSESKGPLTLLPRALMASGRSPVPLDNLNCTRWQPTRYCGARLLAGTPPSI